MADTSEPTTVTAHDLREISTEKGALRYYDSGGPESGPALLFLHGSGPGVTGWRNFRGVLPAFAAHFRCLILEFPGFGVSDDFGGHPMVTAFGTVSPFLDALGVDKVHIVGNSMGGGVGINFATHNPDRVDRLVTIGGIGTNIFSPSPSEGIRLLQEFVEDPTRQRLVDWLKSMVYDQALVTDELIEERWQLATDPETLAAARRMYGKAAFAGDERRAERLRPAAAVGDHAQAHRAHPADLGPRRQGESARHGADPDAHHPQRGAAHLPQLGALGDDRGQGGVRKHRAGVSCRAASRRRSRARKSGPASRRWRSWCSPHRWVAPASTGRTTAVM